MIKLRYVALAIALSCAQPVWAGSCPNLMAKVDEILAKNPDLSAETLAEVKALRAEGEAFHTSGKHAESVDALEEALELLGQ